MKLIFKSVHLVNFMSFLDATVELDGQDYTLVEGENLNALDNAKSNGSGKSAIFDSIMWALTGDTIRGGKNVKNIYAEDGTYVELDFCVNNDSYKIIRSKDHSEYKTNLKIIKNSEDVSGKGIRDSEKLLAEYLPDLTTELLGSVVVLGQGLPQRFTGNTPAGRKEILEKLSKSDFMIEDLKKRIAERKTEISDMLRKNEDEALKSKTTRQMLVNGIETAQNRLNALMDMNGLADLITGVKSVLEGIQGNVKQAEDDLADAENKVKIVLKQIADFNKDVNDKVQGIADKYSEEITSKAQGVTDAQCAYVACSNDLKHAQAELTKLQSITDVCPTCGRKLDGVEKPDTTKAEQDVADLTAKLEKCKEASRVAVDAEKAVKDARDKEIADYKTLTQGYLTTLNVDRDKYEADAKGFKTLLTNLRVDEATHRTILHDYEVQLATRDAEIEGCKQTIETNKNEILAIDDTLKRNEQEHDVIQQRADINTKFSTVVSRDFRGYLLQSIIGFINAKAKEYATRIFGHDNIQFELQGNNINICFQTKEYELLSGGERQKIDLIVQFALRDMMTTYLGFSSNIIVLDEIMDFLDADGCDAVINLLSYAIHDVSSTFIITHHSDLNLPCDNIIHVVKREPGVSSIC